MRALLKRTVLRGRRDTGATLVEYALLTALVGGLALGAIKVASDGASSEVASTSSCVSQRPQPESCRTNAIDAASTTTAAPVASSSTTTTAPTSATTTTPPTTAPPPTTQAPTTTTTAAPSYGGSFSNSSRECTSRRNGNCRIWSATTRLTITTGGSPASGVDVLVTLSDGDTVECRTDSNGRCNLTVEDLSFSNTRSLTFTVTTVNGVAPTTAVETTINRP